MPLFDRLPPPLRLPSGASADAEENAEERRTIVDTEDEKPRVWSNWIFDVYFQLRIVVDTRWLQTRCIENGRFEIGKEWRKCTTGSSLESW